MKHKERISALTISGPIERLDEAIREFVVDKDFHPEDAIEWLSDMRRLRHVEDPDPYTPCLEKADSLLGKFGILPAYTEYGDYDIADTESFIDGLAEHYSGIGEDKDEFSSLPEDDVIVHCLEFVPEVMRDIAQMRYVHVRLGAIAEDKWPELQSLLSETSNQFAVELRRENGEVFILAFALPELRDDLDGNLSRLGFERIRPDPSIEPPNCTAGEIIRQRFEAREHAGDREREVEEQRTSFIEAASPELLRRRAWLAFMSACTKAKSYIGRNAGRFYIVGWAPEDKAKEMDKRCEELSEFACVLSTPAEVKNAKPPVHIREGGIRGVLTPLMKMYGLPAYGTADPRLFMVITYSLFFGMMFGDAGQGACIAVLGFLLYKRTKAWLWRILGICGCSAVIFGLIYGSVFGLEELLPWGGYHPLESEHIMPVLLAGALLGVIVILVCMCFNIVNSFRVGNLKSALFSPNGVCGIVLYTAVIAAIVCAYTKVANLFVGWYIVLFILLPIVLIWIGEPLANLLQGKRDWQPESWGLYIVEGFFDIFESAISYMSNTMSFLRVGAFAISHAGMMMVVSMLSQGASAAGSLLVMVFGNVFVAGLEAALSSIQIIRLEFYEIFGRFYLTGGREFSPIHVEYSK